MHDQWPKYNKLNECLFHQFIYLRDNKYKRKREHTRQKKHVGQRKLSTYHKENNNLGKMNEKKKVIVVVRKNKIK